MFCASDSFSAVPRVTGPVFMFCAPGLVFGGTEGVGSRFHVMCSRTSFRRCRRRRLPFSCFARLYSFSTEPRASAPDFMFCAPGLRRRYRGHRVLFLMFCMPGLIFDEIEGVGSHFHVLRSRTHFRRYRGRRFPISYFASPYTFSAELRALGPVYMFCAPGLVFGSTERVGSRFHVLRCQTCFRRYRGRRAPFSCFALPDSISVVPRASGPVFMFCALGLVFGGTEDVGPVFTFCAPGLIFRGTEGFRS
jgi:hypothetical protein